MKPCERLKGSTGSTLVPDITVRRLLDLHTELRNEAEEADLTVLAGDPSRYWQGRLDGLSLALVLLSNVIDEALDGDGT